MVCFSDVDLVHIVNVAAIQPLVSAAYIVCIQELNAHCLHFVLDFIHLQVEGKIPPHIPSTIPFLGQALSFGTSPIEFLLVAYEKVI